MAATKPKSKTSKARAKTKTNKATAGRGPKAPVRKTRQRPKHAAKAAARQVPVTRARLSASRVAELELAAVDLQLGRWPECPSGVMSPYDSKSGYQGWIRLTGGEKHCCLDYLEGVLWECVDCSNVYRRSESLSYLWVQC